MGFSRVLEDFEWFTTGIAQEPVVCFMSLETHSRSQSKVQPEFVNIVSTETSYSEVCYIN